MTPDGPVYRFVAYTVNYLHMQPHLSSEGENCYFPQIVEEEIVANGGYGVDEIHCDISDRAQV